MSLRIVEWPRFLETASREKSAMTIGVFDGLHLGHRELISRIVRRGPNPTVVTFRENPKKVISPESYQGDIFSLKQKLAAMESLGVSRVVLIDFSENFSRLKGWEFLNLLGDPGGMVFLAIGGNFRCGYRQDTGADQIKEINERKGIPTEVVPQVFLPSGNGTEPVNSSRIRSAIIQGDFALASALMGRDVELDISDLRAVDLRSAGVQSVDRPSGDCTVYDPGSVRRLVPDPGRYAARLYPGAADVPVEIKDGKVFLPADLAKGTGRIEFLRFYE